MSPYGGEQEVIVSQGEEPIPDELIRERSYQIWEREHCPQGKHLEHWLRAKAELRSERLRRMQRGELPNGQGGVYFWDHYG